MKFAATVLSVAMALASHCSSAQEMMGMMDPMVTHPMDGLTTGEHETVVSVLKAEGSATNSTLFAQVSLLEPPKEEVKAFIVGDDIPRRAVVYTKEATSFYKAIVDIVAGEVISYEAVEGQGMWIGEEFNMVYSNLMNNTEIVEGLALRGLNSTTAYCYPLSGGDYDLGIEDGRRIGRAPCWGNGNGTNGVAYPVEGLIALVDLYTYEVLEVTDSGVVPMNEDEFGFTTELLRERFGTLRGEELTRIRERNLRKFNTRKTRIEARVEANKKKPGYRKLQVPGGSGISMEGSMVKWDIWSFHYRVDMRQGTVLSNVMVNDMGTWREVMYSAMLSEVFVPYHDPDELWWYRTYMDVGEYGFGLSYSPLTPGLDCPAHSMFMPTTLHDSFGMPFDVPDSVCIFERDMSAPAWRHYQGGDENTTEPTPGRSAVELVVRSAATIGNYDYLLDYVFQRDGVIKIAVGATGQDITKGAAAKSMLDAGAAEETMYGTLIAENLIAPNHDHFFNFRLDMDVDGEDNQFIKGSLVTTDITAPNIPRKSMWTIKKDVIPSEIPARTKPNPAMPAYYLFGNPNVDGYLGNTPSYQLSTEGTWAYSLFSEDDFPHIRNAYVENSLWVTPYDPTQLYAGGEYVWQSNGTDTLKTWTDADRSIDNTDIVVYYTCGFYHHPRMEDWPVMPTKWMQFKLIPFNFFSHNPAINLAPTTPLDPTVAVARDGE